MNDQQQPDRPFQMSPGMAKVNKQAAGCGYWLVLFPVIVFAVVFVVALLWLLF